MQILMAWLLLFVPATQAGLLDLTNGTQKLEKVPLATQANLETAHRKHLLQVVGSGLRYKKVVFVKAKVYVGQLFLSDPEKFARSEQQALASLQGSKAIAMRLTFLRDVEAKALQGAFADAFKENGVDPTAEPLKEFLSAVADSGGVKDGQSIVVAGERADNQEIIYFENADGKSSSVKGGEGFLQQVYSLWLGKPADSGVESFKKDIIGR